MSSISTNNSKSIVIKQSKHNNINPSSILEYNFLKSKKTSRQLTPNDSRTDLSSNAKMLTNQSFNNKNQFQSRDKNVPSYRSSSTASFLSNKLNSFYAKSKERQLLHKRKIDFQHTLKHQQDLKNQRPYVPLSDISRELHNQRLKRSNSVQIPVYKRQAEKINVNHTRNLKQLIINESNTTAIMSSNKNSRCFEKKAFDNWIQKNELWKKNSLTKTMNKAKIRMIEINEQEEQFQFQPQVMRYDNDNSNSSTTLQYSKSRNKHGNNLSTTAKSLKSNHSVSSLKKEYDKIQIMPSFKPIINNRGISGYHKRPTPISIKSNHKKNSKGIILKLNQNPIRNMKTTTHEYSFNSVQNETVTSKPQHQNLNQFNQEQMQINTQNRISNVSDTNESHISEKTSECLYKLNVREGLPNGIPMNIIVNRNNKCL